MPAPWKTAALSDPGCNRFAVAWILSAVCAAWLFFISSDANAAKTAPPGLDSVGGVQWGDNIDRALTRAVAEHQPVIALFSTPGCGWCKRLKSEVFPDPEVAALLGHFVRVEVDVIQNPAAAQRYQVSGVPAIRILSADGQIAASADGFMPGAEFQRLLKSALNSGFLAKVDATFAALPRMLDEGAVPAERWPEIMLALGDKAKRRDLHERILKLKPFPRRELVALLENPRLAVRLGAMEVLEEIAGDTFGFDPWIASADSAQNADAAAKWKAWAGEAQAGAAQAYAALTGEQVRAYVRDIVSENRERSVRAMRMLEHGGAAAIDALGDFLKQNPQLPDGAKSRLREVQYALSAPALSGTDPSGLAHQLVFGNLDTRLKAIGALHAGGRQSVAILRDFLDDRDPMVREAVVDALVAAGRRDGLPLLAAHLEREKDVNVVEAVLRGLGRMHSKRGLGILTSYLSNPNEDLAIVALESIAKLKATPGDELGKCLDDPRWRVRVAALDTAAALHDAALAGKIESLLNDKDEFVRSSAVKALADLAAHDSAPKLEQAFLREDNLKAPVAHAFAKMSLPIPKSFGPALQGREPDALLAVLEALADSGTSGIDLASQFARHENKDVACTAIRLVAKHGMEDEKNQALIAEVLRGGDREKQLAALESLRIERATMEFYRSRNAPASAAPGGGSAVDKLLDAFTGGDAGASKKQEAAPAPSSDDVLNAFLGGDGKAAPAGGAQRGLAGLFAAMESLLGSSRDGDVKFQAAIQLCRAGNGAAVKFLAADFASRTGAQRRAIAQGLEEVASEEAVPLLRELLRDASDEVRAPAAAACLENAAKPAFIDALFEELLRADAKLQPQEIYRYNLLSAARKHAASTAIAKWAHRILSEQKDAALQAFGLVLIETCWKSGDTKIVRKFFDSSNVWLRRAAFHALGKHDPEAFAAEMARVAGDSSEYVRMVVPDVLLSERSAWLHYFDETRFERDQNWWTSTSTRRHALSDAAIETLRKLTDDRSDNVRAEAFFCLLSGRETVDLARFVDTLNSFADRKAIADRVGQYLAENYKSLGQNFRVLLPFFEESDRNEERFEEIRAHFGDDAEPAAEKPNYVARARQTEPLPASFLDAPQAGAASADGRVKVVYFFSPGCTDCERAERMLAELKQSFPLLDLDKRDIRQIDAMRLNEALCERFHVPDGVRLVTPAIFASTGYLIRNDIAFDRLGDLLTRSSGAGDQWMSMPAESLARAASSISGRYAAMSVGVVSLAGLLDGINPCAFATIIFFISYLQVARRSPRQIAQVGLAFIAGVFLAYFLLGLGLVEIVSRLRVLRGASVVLNWALAAFALVLMVLSIRDGVLCLRGQLAETTLQLPQFLKTRIHGVIRQGARHSRFVIAAFLSGLAIACLELACTGQVYAPTILFMLQSGRASATAYLLLYNLAFIVPLFAIFAFAYLGLKSDALIRIQKKHTALVKFATALLFFVLLLLLVLGNKISPDVWMSGAGSTLRQP
jgi:HEAT repeat protein/cytochrome c biogenesis protein CcdA/glutaredoxin